MLRARVLAGLLPGLLTTHGIAQVNLPVNPDKLGTVHFATSCNQPAPCFCDELKCPNAEFSWSRYVRGTGYADIRHS